MTAIKAITAPDNEIHWRYEVAPDRGSKVWLLTIGNIAVSGLWYGDLGEYLLAWCPMPRRDRASERAIIDARERRAA